MADSRRGGLSVLSLSCGLTVLLVFVCLGGRADGQVAISEFQYDFLGPDTGKQWVELKNFSEAESYDLSGHYLYMPPNDFRFPGGTVVPAGEILVVYFNRSGEDTPNEIYTGIAGQRDLRDADSLALYSTNLFFDPSRIIDFLQWGEPSSAVEFVAVAAGIWTAGEFVDSSVIRPGTSFGFDGVGDSADDWCVDGTPSPGRENDECTDPRIVSSVRINELGSDFLELTNMGTETELLNGYRLAIASSFFDFPDGISVSPGALLVVHFGEYGASDSENIFSGASLASIDFQQPGSLALFGAPVLDDSTLLIDFLQWGGSGQSFEGLAGTARLWTRETHVDVSILNPDGALVSGGGVGVDSWTVDNTATPGESNDTVANTDVVINEVLISPFGGGAQFIEIYNGGFLDAHLSGFGLCLEGDTSAADPDCFEFPEHTSLSPDSYLLVWLNVGGVNGAGRVFTGLFSNAETAGDAVALLVSPDFDSPGNYIDYVRWGTGGAGTRLGELAVQAGIWLEGDSVDVGVVPEGSSLAYSGFGSGPDRYVVDPSPTALSSNDILSNESRFVRGDCRQDTLVDATDVIHLLTFLFLGGVTIDCADSCDWDDSAELDFNDAIFQLTFLFLGKAVRSPPFECGPDPSVDLLGCQSFAPCDQP